MEGNRSSFWDKFFVTPFTLHNESERGKQPEKLFQSLVEEQLKAEEYFKKNRRQPPKSMDLWVDSDDEFKSELESAVIQYKKNIKKNEPAKTEYIDESRNRKETSNNIDNPRKDKVNSNGNAATDVQELINYFFLREKDKKTERSRIDYEKQGAIPKVLRGESKCVQFDIKKKQADTQPKRKNKRNVSNQQNDLEYTFIKSSDSDEVIVKINEESCSKPFYYIVPENPCQNFFLSRGSYYVVPKVPCSSEERIFFHPENTPGIDREPPLNNHSKPVQQICTNNLGKEVFQKVDSHLNIGPLDVKLSDSNNNLQTNYDLNKVFDKSWLNVCQNGVEVSESGVGDLVEETDVGAEGGNQDEESTAEADRLREVDKNLQALLIEFPTLDADSAIVLAERYRHDEDGLKTYIESVRLKQKIEEQLNRMILSLPESDFDELRAKCNEFKGDEELVTNYILESLKDYKISQQVLDLLFVLPDADPEFLRAEIEKLNGDDNAFNILTDQLLDNKDYPKVSEDPLSAERKKWWRTHVTKFNVKNYILKVPNPSDFAGAAGDNNKEDRELIMKFLQSRYPSQRRDFLTDAFENHNKNVTKTCEYLNPTTPFVKLSESSFGKEAFSEVFLEEICYIDHKKEIDDYLKEVKERKEIEKEEARLNDSFLFCPLCAEDELVASEAICCLDGHLYCKDCIKRYVYVKISDGVYKFACPSKQCDTVFSCATLQEILPDNVLSNITNKQQAEEISRAKVDGLESCPYCEFAYIPNPEDKIFKCQNTACLIETCRKCHEKNHIPLRCEEIERPVDLEARKKIEESMSQELIRVCPNCQKKFVKIDGCNKMACVCGTVVCYVCRKQVSGYEHFSSYARDSKCPLYSNNEVLHTREVFQAGIRTREEILRENENIRLLHDPTTSNKL